MYRFIITSNDSDFGHCLASGLAVIIWCLQW